MSEEKIKMCYYNKTELCLVFNISGFPMTQKEICNACKRSKSHRELIEENKRLREALEKIEAYRPRLHQFNLSSIDFEDVLDIAKQALGGTCD